MSSVMLAHPTTVHLRNKMHMSIVTAKVTHVKFGTFSIEGLLSEDGKFYIAIPQIAELFQLLERNTKRDIKTLLGERFSVLKLQTPLNSNAVNAIPLNLFDALLLKLAVKGNIKALEMADALIGLSLHQIFCDAFNVKFDLEERQAWLKKRFEGKIERSKFTDAIKVYQEALGTYGNNPHEFSRATDIINQKVVGMCAKQAKEHYNVPKYGLLRDYLPAPTLKSLTSHEEVAAGFLRRGYKPTEAAKEAIDFLNYN